MSGFVEWNDNGQDLWFTFVKDTPNRFRVSGGTAFKVDGDSSKNQYTVLHDIRWDPSSDKPFQGVSYESYIKSNEYLPEALIDRMYEEAYLRGLKQRSVIDESIARYSSAAHPSSHSWENETPYGSLQSRGSGTLFDWSVIQHSGNQIIKDLGMTVGELQKSAIFFDEWASVENRWFWLAFTATHGGKQYKVIGGEGFYPDKGSDTPQYDVLVTVSWSPWSKSPDQEARLTRYPTNGSGLRNSFLHTVLNEAQKRGLNNVVVDKAKNGGLGSSSSLSLGGRDSDIFYLDARDGLRSGDVIQPDGPTGSTVEGHDAFGLYESPEPLYRHGANMEQTVYRVQAVDYDSASDQAISKNSHIDRADAYASTVIVLGPSESSDW